MKSQANCGSTGSPCASILDSAASIANWLIAVRGSTVLPFKSTFQHDQENAETSRRQEYFVVLEKCPRIRKFELVFQRHIAMQLLPAFSASTHARVKTCSGNPRVLAGSCAHSAALEQYDSEPKKDAFPRRRRNGNSGLLRVPSD